MKQPNEKLENTELSIEHLIGNTASSARSFINFPKTSTWTKLNNLFCFQKEKREKIDIKKSKFLEYENGHLETKDSISFVVDGEEKLHYAVEYPLEEVEKALKSPKIDGEYVVSIVGTISYPSRFFKEGSKQIVTTIHCDNEVASNNIKSINIKEKSYLGSNTLFDGKDLIEIDDQQITKKQPCN